MPRPERPLDGTGDPVIAFAAGLRRLREEAGNPSYRALALRANFSAASLAAAASGRKLPTLAVTRAYVEACSGDAQQWELLWRAVAVPEAPLPEVPVEKEGDSPYAGLAPLQADDAEFFFGRRHLVEDLVRRVSRRRLVVLFGPSGVGKSSVVRAGLLPAARAGAMSGRPAPWPAVLLVPEAKPLTELSVRLAALARIPAGALLDDLAKDPARAELVVRQALCEGPDETELLLVVDQFERVFSADVNGAERAGFIAALVALCQTVGSRARVVLAVRADHYPRFVDHPELLAAMQDGQVLVGGMSPAELRDAVVKPAERVGARVEGALVSSIVAEVAGRPGALPLASHALLEAWRRRRGTTVALAGYQAAGGVDGAVATTAEGVYRTFDGEQRTAVRRLLLRMIDIDDLDGVRGRRVSLSQLGSADRDTSVVSRMVDARLLTTDRDSVELAHESLIRAWPRLRSWVEEDRETLQAHRRLAEAAAAWEELEHDPGALYRGILLARTRLWTASRFWHPALSPRERRFVDESVRQEAAEIRSHRRRRSHRRLISSILVVTLSLGTVAGGRSTTNPWRCARGAVGLLSPQSGLLVAAEDGYQGPDAGMLRARTPRDIYGTWEQFQICRRPGDETTLMLRGYAARQRFFSARPRWPGDAVLRLTAAAMGPDEWLEAVPVADGGIGPRGPEGNFLLRSVGRGRYLAANPDGPPRYAGRLEATAEDPALATRFRLVPLT